MYSDECKGGCTSANCTCPPRPGAVERAEATKPKPAKNVSEWTVDELRVKSQYDLFIIATALIAVGHMRDIELQRERKAHAMAQLNYWGRVHHEAGLALTEAERLNREGNK